jgi:hypothetical protein
MPKLVKRRKALDSRFRGNDGVLAAQVIKQPNVIPKVGQ